MTTKLLVLKDKMEREVYQIPMEGVQALRTNYVVKGDKAYGFKGFSQSLRLLYFVEADDVFIWQADME